MKNPRWFGITLLAFATLLSLFVVGTRFTDGPFELIAGGPFTTGVVATEQEPDWNFVGDVQTVEFQLQHPARSRTTWIIEHEGRIYIPCGYMNTLWGRVWKKWPIEAARDGRAILRIDKDLYARHLVRVKSSPALPAIIDKLAKKYKVPATVESVSNGSLWIFEMQGSREGI